MKRNMFAKRMLAKKERFQHPHSNTTLYIKGEAVLRLASIMLRHLREELIDHAYVCLSPLMHGACYQYIPNITPNITLI